VTTLQELERDGRTREGSTVTFSVTTEFDDTFEVTYEVR